MMLKKLVLATSLLFAPILLLAQGAQSQGGLDPATLLKPLSDSWPTYSGDYTGRRYSALELVRRVTGEELSPRYLVRYLRERYGTLYRV